MSDTKALTTPWLWRRKRSVTQADLTYGVGGGITSEAKATATHVNAATEHFASHCFPERSFSSWRTARIVTAIKPGEMQ